MRTNELGARTIIIEVGTVEMVSIGQMRLSRVRSQTAGGLDRMLRQCQPGRRMIYSDNVDLVRSQTAGGLDRMLRQCQPGRRMIYSDNVDFVMAVGQLVVGEEETGITCDSLLQEINYQGQAFFLPRTKHGHGAEILGLHV